jgi:hypothetical protein
MERKRIVLWIFILVGSIFLMCGCSGGLWSETDYEREQRLSGESNPDAPEDPATPAWVEDWFEREEDDPAVFPDLVEATDEDTVLAVAAWVDAFDHDATGASHQYRTTGETVDAGGGDTSSLAWLNYHCCRANAIAAVSVEFVEWDDGTEEYYCAWRDAGLVYMIVGDTLVLHSILVGGIGDLVYGFDDEEYWEYE